jgi:hypothetical protein
MKVTILAVSSSGGSYPVEFSDESGGMRVFCHCQAGMLQQMCKHKLALLKGDLRMLHDATQEKLLRQVLASPAYPAMEQSLYAYERAVSDVEKDMTKLKHREKMLKTDFAYELTHGRRRN